MYAIRSVNLAAAAQTFWCKFWSHNEFPGSLSYRFHYGFLCTRADFHLELSGSECHRVLGDDVETAWGWKVRDGFPIENKEEKEPAALNQDDSQNLRTNFGFV